MNCSVAVDVIEKSGRPVGNLRHLRVQGYIHTTKAQVSVYLPLLCGSSSNSGALQSTRIFSLPSTLPRYLLLLTHLKLFFISRSLPITSAGSLFPVASCMAGSCFELLPPPSTSKGKEYIYSHKDVVKLVTLLVYLTSDG
jgi:hypothetical protein